MVDDNRVLTDEFGEGYSFTDHTYDFLGLPPRTYSSFKHATREAGASRVYGGLHYWPAIEAGNVQGTGIAKYIQQNIKFK